MQDGKHVILIIDDNPDLLKALSILLEANQYKVVQSATAKEGLEAYAASKPDLVIVDLMMEDIDAGKNFAKALKDQGNEAPVFLLSSAGDGVSETIDYSELGFSGVIQKPYDNQGLLSLIKSKLDS